MRNEKENTKCDAVSTSMGEDDNRIKGNSGIGSLNLFSGGTKTNVFCENNMNSNSVNLSGRRIPKNHLNLLEPKQVSNGPHKGSV